MNVFEYHAPKSLKEAVDYLLEKGENTMILNGGTDLIVRMRDCHIKPDYVMDIKKIDGLTDIKFENGKVFIGACVTLNDLGLHPRIQKSYPYLAQAALSIGSRQVRNRATCIGNICNASPLADTATPLLSLDAKVHIYSKSGERDVALSDFFVFVRKTILKHGEIVTGITFDDVKSLGIFTKVSRRKEVDLSTVCATVIKTDDTYAISCGAVAPTPIRLHETEALLNSKELTEELIKEASEHAYHEVTPISDIRATEDYRREMVKVLLKHSLNEWL
ncbi:xanthine dehydrogenase family protein subunit M [Acidaminobacter sp. JC074]|uniref:FAD binding domain-containing protein n=1 Tax=Acidaminobacter sp. JC074 TaxID=2530199 RepID=UPI001F107596|nr:xanthine dehydrogenase family protein subunit M [Acidaminobacter sp. JC074]MCH4887790.1 xanthine dehydrogenase family protein subunit M [Acidaminobacter sp. JC074]